MKNKVIKLNESDIERLVKRIIKEDEGEMWMKNTYNQNFHTQEEMNRVWEDLNELNDDNYSMINQEINIESVIMTPTSSWFNNSEDPIFIDATATGVDAHNWTWARSQDWCREEDTHIDIRWSHAAHW